MKPTLNAKNICAWFSKAWVWVCINFSKTTTTKAFRWIILGKWASRLSMQFNVKYVFFFFKDTHTHVHYILIYMYIYRYIYFNLYVRFIKMFTRPCWVDGWHVDSTKDKKKTLLLVSVALSFVLVYVIFETPNGHVHRD